MANFNGGTLGNRIARPVILTSADLPFFYDPDTQSGNIPLASQLVANIDGSFTFTPGDGGLPVVIPGHVAGTILNTLTMNAGILANVVDGSLAELSPPATLMTDAFGVPLGYLLPL